ncbi:hypothetical protein EV714DRAFT_276153 [Schizophyllum commune]
MTKLKPYSGSSRKLYACIDVGTTFSGISYCIAEPGLPPEVKGVTRFPAQEHVGGNAKIPSVLFYSGRGRVKAAGAETLLADNIEEAEVKGWTKAEWFKLHLAPQYDGSPWADRDLPPLPSGMTAQEVFTDFLRYLLSCLQSFIEESYPCGKKLWEYLFDTAEFTLTHPNGWGGPQQEDLREMAVDAGLVRTHADAVKRVHFVTEGEASLHFCIHDGIVGRSMQRGQGMIMVDAGGGTIDLSAYSANQSGSRSTRGTYSEIAASQCVFQGASYVTQRATDYFLQVFRGSQWEQDVQHMKDVFDQRTKLTIKNDRDSVTVKFGGSKDADMTTALKVRRGAFILPGKKVAEFFMPSIGAAYTAALEQISIAQKRGKTITSVYVVGGFGANELLFSKLRTCLGKLNIDVCRPDAHTNKAVADGGVLFSLNGRVTARVSRCTYGVAFCVVYDPDDREHVRRRDTAFVDPSGVWHVPDAFASILPGNTQVSQEREFKYSFYRNTYKRPTQFPAVTLQVHEGAGRAPKWTDVDEDEFSDLCQIEGDPGLIDFAKRERNAKGEIYWRLEYDVVLRFGLTELQAQIAWFDDLGEEHRGKAHIIYNH